MRTIALEAAAIAAAFLLASSDTLLRAQSCTPGGPGGPIPASGTGGGGSYPSVLPPAPFVSVLNVPSAPSAGAVTEVRLKGLFHTRSGDLTAVLEDPSGAKVLLFDRQGAQCNFDGDYSVVAPQQTTLVFPFCGSFGILNQHPFSQAFGAWPSGTHGIENTSLSMVVPQAGDWTLVLYDWADTESGSLDSWELCFGTPPPPPPSPVVPCNGEELATASNPDTTTPPGGQVFFDAQVFDPAGVVVSQLDSLRQVAAGFPQKLDVFVKPGSYFGWESDFGAWTKVSTGMGITAGHNRPTVFELQDFHLPAGSWGVSLVADASTSFPMTFGAQSYQNQDLKLTLGASKSVPWSLFGPTTHNVIWNGALRYDCGGPITYCTAKTTSGGCVPDIAWAGTPSAGGNYTVTCSEVEPGQIGLLFYGLSGPKVIHFQAGFLCVQPPLLRLPVQDSGGSAPCSGSFSQSLDALISGLPLGQMVNCQYWFRDPGTLTGSGLSDANELLVQ